MADPRAFAPRIPVLLLFLLLLLAAILGGVAARMLPLDTAEAPRALAGPAEESLAPLASKSAPAVVNIATLQPSPVEQNPLL